MKDEGREMIPYADISEKADRRWTVRLLNRLDAADLPEDELDDLVRALQAVSDPRSFHPLEAVVCDIEKPPHIRIAAGDALRGLHHVALDIPADKLRRWWLEGDAILRRISLLFMDGIRCPDVVVKIAADPTHLLQADALDRMDFWFDLPGYEAVKIAGLSHPDPKVRAAAAYVLLWDEPVAAERKLIETTHDAVLEVAAEATNTLEYYPSLRVISRLHELLHHAADMVREQAQDSFQSIRYELLNRLSSKDEQIADHVRRWLRPVWDILDFAEEELTPEEDDASAAHQEQPAPAIPLGDLLALLADVDASPLVIGDRLRSNGWSDYAKAERRRLRPVLLTHTDQLVREQGAQAFAAWGDVRSLLNLVLDADFCVRKSAMYRLGQLPSNPMIADVAWDHLSRPSTIGTHETETLATFVKHADPVVAVRRLGWMAGDHPYREGLRVAAVEHLTELRAAGEVGRLAGLLLEPPAVTWAFHIAMIDAIKGLGLPAPEIAYLREVDNLHMQTALAGLVG
jgi:hypothetical protein